MIKHILVAVTFLLLPPPALEEVFAECRADLVCRMAYPRLEERYNAEYERLSDKPVEIEGVTVDGVLFTQVITALSENAPGSVPAVIAAVEAGDEIALLQAAAIANTPLPDPDGELTFVITAHPMRPLGLGLALLLGTVVIGTLGVMTVHTTRLEQQLAWLMSFKRIHWLPVLASLLLVVGASIVRATGDDPASTALVVETVIPIIAALQASMLFVPGQEPALELQIASPRPIWWVPLERLLTVFATQTFVALVGVGVAAALYPDLDIVLALLRWIPPVLFLSAIAFTMTIHSKEVSLGAVFVALFWGIMLAFSEALLPPSPLQPAYPFPLSILTACSWMIHAYLQPDDMANTYYLINRVILLGSGCVLYMLSFMRLSNPENLLD